MGTGVSGPTASPGDVAGVKSWLEAGEQGWILSVDHRNMMACQICSSLICLVTVTGSGSQTQPQLSPCLEKPCFVCIIWLMKNAATHCLVHGIGFSSVFSGLVPGEGQIHPQPALCKGTGGLGPPAEPPAPSPILTSSQGCGGGHGG